MFPGPNAQVHYNEAGEPLGWDYPADNDHPYDDMDDFEMDAYAARAEAYAEELAEEHADGMHDDSPNEDCDECDIQARKKEDT